MLGLVSRKLLPLLLAGSFLLAATFTKDQLKLLLDRDTRVKRLETKYGLGPFPDKDDPSLQVSDLFTRIAALEAKAALPSRPENSPLASDPNSVLLQKLDTRLRLLPGTPPPPVALQPAAPPATPLNGGQKTEEQRMDPPPTVPDELRTLRERISALEANNNQTPEPRPEKGSSLTSFLIPALIFIALLLQVWTIFNLQNLGGGSQSEVPSSMTDTLQKLDNKLGELTNQMRRLENTPLTPPPPRTPPKADPPRAQIPPQALPTPRYEPPRYEPSPQPRAPQTPLGQYIAAANGSADDQFAFEKRVTNRLSAINPDHRRTNPHADIVFHEESRGFFMAVEFGSDTLLFPAFSGRAEGDEYIFERYGPRFSRPATVRRRGGEWVLVEPGAFE
jgi:hypothetical protein